jgi:DNA-binding PadR family transcriptional regulator
MAGFRMTTSIAKVLRIFLEDVSEPRYGFELMRRTRFPSGTLYPILARLEHAGWVAGQREVVDPAVAGRPPRRLYRLTAEGAQAARVELAVLSAQLKPPPYHGERLPREGGTQWA